MYYTYQCPYCLKVYYIFSDNQEEAANELFAGLKHHQSEYGEDKYPNTLTEYSPEDEVNMIYSQISGSKTIPTGSYPFE